MNAASSFQCLVEPYLNDLLAYCKYLTRSHWDGEDIYQAALLKSYLYYTRKGPFKETRRFLLKVAKHLWIDEFRKRRRYVMIDQPIQISTSDCNYVDIRIGVEQLADCLPARSFEMYMQYEIFGYSLQEIAQKNHCSVQAVKNVLHRARLLLKLHEPVVNRKRGKAPNLDHWIHAVMAGHCYEDGYLPYQTL